MASNRRRKMRRVSKKKFKLIANLNKDQRNQDHIVYQTQHQTSKNQTQTMSSSHIGSLYSIEISLLKLKITIEISKNFYIKIYLKSKSKKKICISEDHLQMRILNLKYVIQVMGAGHITTLLIKFRQGSIEDLKLCWVQTMTKVRIFGHLHACFTSQ